MGAITSVNRRTSCRGSPAVSGCDRTSNGASGLARPNAITLDAGSAATPPVIPEKGQNTCDRDHSEPARLVPPAGSVRFRSTPVDGVSARSASDTEHVREEVARHRDHACVSRPRGVGGRARDGLETELPAERARVEYD